MKYRKSRSRADKTRQRQANTEGDTDGELQLKAAHFDVNGSNDGEAMAARQSGQFKRSGFGWRLIITLAVNI